MLRTEKPEPRWILRILMGLCAAGIICSVFILISDSRDYTEGDAAYQQIRMIRESPEGQQDLAHEPLQIAGAASAEESQGGQTAGVDFTALEKINSDVVAWITAPGTEIDYPVVQGNDNDFYLHHLFTGRRNKVGSIFLDYRNHGDFSDRNTIVYGHNMKDGSMFSALANYKSQNYYDRFPTMTLYTPGGNFQVELFAGMVVSGNSESIRYTFKDADDFLQYTNALKKGSAFQSDTVVNADDRIITLCTCSYEFNNARFALYGKLTPMK